MMSDADFEAVRKLAAEGRRIPDVVLRALMRRMELEDVSLNDGGQSDLPRSSGRDQLNTFRYKGASVSSAIPA